MKGTKIVMEWKRWLDSIEGRQASNPDSLPPQPRMRQYLENRLERAFQAGIAAAERDAKAVDQPRVDQ